MGRKFYSQKLKDEAIRMIQDGNSVHEVSCHFEVSTFSIYMWLKKAGVPVPNPNMQTSRTQPYDSRKIYTDKDKIEATILSLRIGIHNTGRRLSISPSSLVRWRREFRHSEEVIKALKTNPKSDPMNDVFVAATVEFLQGKETKSVEYYKTKCGLLQSLYDLEQNK